LEENIPITGIFFLKSALLKRIPLYPKGATIAICLFEFLSKHIAIVAPLGYNGILFSRANYILLKGSPINLMKK